MAQVVILSDEEKRLIADDYIKGISITELCKKHKHDNYRIKAALVELGVYQPPTNLMAIEMQTPCYSRKIWKSPEYIDPVKGKQWYDVTEMPLDSDTYVYGCWSPKKYKGLPEWKKQLQRKFNASGGNKGVNYGYVME